MDLVRVPEDEPGGQDVLQGVAALPSVDLTVFRQVLQYNNRYSCYYILRII